MNSLFFLLFFLVGGFLFVLGFRKYRQYRLLEDTPRAPVRSIPMGLVHLHGKSTGEQLLTSPLTRTPCYYYKAWVELWTMKGKDDRMDWETIRTEADARVFYLDDGTGKVRVIPYNADFNVPRTFQGETGPDAKGKRLVDPSLGVAGPSNQELLNYMQRVSDAAQAARAAAIAAPDSTGKTAAKVLMGVSASGVKLSRPFADLRLRFTEECLIADRQCNILGTCVENPTPTDEHDRNLIQKGINEPTFVISDKAEGALEKNLRRTAMSLILVGAILMLAMVAAVLGVNGWL
jgi:predicted nucleic acid-binding Zn ribbon protein